MSFGIKVGRFVGAAGAYAVEGAVRGAVGLGGFAQDVATGAELGYTEKHAELLVERAVKDAAREARKAEYARQLKLAGEPVAVAPKAVKTVKVRS